MTVGKVEGLDTLLKQFGRISQFPKEMARDLRQANKEVGRMAARKVKPQIPRSSEPFKVYKGTPGAGRAPKGQGVVIKTIPPGTLRRSIGVRNSRGSKINVFVGPRKGGALRNDGYFAQWTEDGGIGGRNKSVNSPTYRKIAPALSRLLPAMGRLMVMKYRMVFDKYRL